MLEIKDKYITEFNKDNKEVARCKDGDIVKFYTKDCFNDLVRCEADREKMNSLPGNPATGPLYVEDLKPGDVLKVSILDIKVDDFGICSTMKDCGVLWKNNELRTKEFNIDDNKTKFNDLTLEIKPMIGVIGLSPSDKGISTEDAWCHGGNMDCPLLNKGTSIYLPCEVNGGLLAIGDLHALMGDGEIVGTGIEIKGEVTVKVNVIKNFKLNWPLLETEDAYYINANGETCNKAFTRAFLEMQRLVAKTKDWDNTDAAIYLSLRGITATNQSCMSDHIDHEEMGPNCRVGVYKKEINIMKNS